MMTFDWYNIAIYGIVFLYCWLQV